MRRRRREGDSQLKCGEDKRDWRRTRRAGGGERDKGCSGCGDELENVNRQPWLDRGRRRDGRDATRQQGTTKAVVAGGCAVMQLRIFKRRRRGPSF